MLLAWGNGISSDLHSSLFRWTNYASTGRGGHFSARLTASVKCHRFCCFRATGEVAAIMLAAKRDDGTCDATALADLLIGNRTTQLRQDAFTLLHPDHALIVHNSGAVGLAQLQWQAKSNAAPDFTMATAMATRSSAPTLAPAADRSQVLVKARRLERVLFSLGFP